MQASFAKDGHWYVFDDTQFVAPTLVKGLRDKPAATRWIAREERKAREAAAAATAEAV